MLELGEYKVDRYGALLFVCVCLCFTNPLRAIKEHCVACCPSVLSGFLIHRSDRLVLSFPSVVRTDDALIKVAVVI